jgi:hypothetical protein
MAASLDVGEIPAALSPKAGTQGELADLCAALGDVERLAGQVTSLKKETLEKEAAVLKEILDRITPLVPILSQEYEAFCRPMVVVLTKKDEVPFPIVKNTYVFSEQKLLLYDNGHLVKSHRFGEFCEGPRPGWEMTEEAGMTAEAAIKAYGLPAIAEGIMTVFEWTRSAIVLKEELVGKLAALSSVLEAFRCTQ